MGVAQSPGLEGGPFYHGDNFGVMKDLPGYISSVSSFLVRASIKIVIKEFSGQ